MGKFFKHSHLRDEGVVGYDPTNPKTVLDPNSEFLTAKHKHAPTGEAIERLAQEWFNRKPPKGVRKEGYTGKLEKISEAVKKKVFKPDSSYSFQGKTDTIRPKIVLPKAKKKSRYSIPKPKDGSLGSHALNLVSNQRLDFKPNSSHRITVGKLRNKDMMGNKMYGVGYRYSFK